MAATELHAVLQESLYDDLFASLGPNVQTLLRAMDARAALVAEMATRGPESLGVELSKQLVRESMTSLYAQFGKPSSQS